MKRGHLEARLGCGVDLAVTARRINTCCEGGVQDTLPGVQFPHADAPWLKLQTGRGGRIAHVWGIVSGFDMFSQSTRPSQPATSTGRFKRMAGRREWRLNSCIVASGGKI